VYICILGLCGSQPIWLNIHHILLCLFGCSIVCGGGPGISRGIEIAVRIWLCYSAADIVVTTSMWLSRSGLSAVGYSADCIHLSMLCRRYDIVGVDILIPVDIQSLFGCRVRFGGVAAAYILRWRWLGVALAW